MQLMYYLVKEVGYTGHDVLHELAFYEVLQQFQLFQKEIEARAKQQEEENKKMDEQMRSMRSSMSKPSSIPSYSAPNISAPKI